MDSTFYDEKAKKYLADKFAIAFRAALFLEEGDALLIDAGTSLTPLATVIAKMAEEYASSTHFTIMTHNRGAFDALTKTSLTARLNIFQTGGRYDMDLNASFGHQAESAYEAYHPKWVFIGQSGVDADRGLFCHGNTEELSLKRIIFSKPAFTRVILSDYTKLGIPGGLCFGSSDTLTDNVEHCVLLTNNPRKTKNPNDSDEEHSNHEKRFERQTTILTQTYEVKIADALYEITHNGEDEFTVSLVPTEPPLHGPSWMGVYDKNWIRVIKKNKEWSVEEIFVARLAKDQAKTASSHE